MTRRSPQTERLVEIVEFLAANPQREYRLTDLARLVEMDAATCHPMLTELTRVGWLVKDRTRKTYRLGPRLVAVGSAAQVSLPIAACARPTMERLAADTGLPACLFLPSSDHLVIADLTYPDDQRLPLQPGDHVEFGPPFGAVLAAWASPFHVDAWLQRIESGAEDPVATWQTLRTIRRRHFSVELSPQPASSMRELTDAVSGVLHGSRRAEWMIGGQRPVMTPGLMLDGIEETTTYLPLSVSGACFDPGGTPVAALSVLAMAAPTTGRELLTLGAQVRTAADVVTRHLGASPPRLAQP